MMKLENEKLGLSVEVADPILQRHVEAFFKAKREADGDNAIRLSSPEHHGGILRAAWKCGLLLPPAREVADMAPAAVRWLGRKLDELLGEVLEVPPE
jgi:hypothetical protein